MKTLTLGFLLLVLNSAYLAARADASLFYFVNVGLHVALGLALGVLGLRHARRAGLPAGRADRALVALLAAAGLTGAVLTVTGATRPFRALLVVHVVLATLAALGVPARLLAGRAAWTASLERRLARPLALVALAAVGVAAVGIVQGWPEESRRRRIVNPALPPLTMEGEGAGEKSPFFPSSAETNVGGTIPSDFFLTSESCGRCHQEIYRQWNSSAHHFSSFNNQWYRKSIEYMQDVVGTRPSKWCAGCHDHAVFFNGRFDRPIKEQIHTPEAQAGLGCTSCHSIVHVKSTMGQGDFTVEYPPLHDLSVSDNPALRFVHDLLLRWDPQPHRQTFLKTFHTEQAAEFCSSCHKVHLDAPVNAYRWFRGFNEYDNWQASGVSGEGARSFYYPPAPKTCPDCHMPLVAADDPAARDGKVHSHRFPGANTALPFVNGDEEQLRVTQDFLRAGQVTLDVFALSRPPAGAGPAATRAADGEPRAMSTFAVGEEALHAGTLTLAPAAEVTAPLDLADAAVRRGESVRVDVVVRTRGVGHFFPGGTVDAFDVWVEFEARDDRGRLLLHSGAVADEGRGPVDPGAHFYRSLMLDERGNPINKRNAWMTRSLAYVRLVPPGAADTVRYRLQIPPDAGQSIRLEARLNYRKFAWWHTQWAYAGVRDPSDPNPSVGPGHDDGRWVFTGDTSDVSGALKQIPNLPITVMARAQAGLRVLPEDAPVPEPRRVAGQAQRERFNDYGIGLLLQGDLRASEAAFREVVRADPNWPEGHVNLARGYVQEGRSDDAERELTRALQLDPELPKAHFFMGLVKKSQGRYDDALAHLERTLSRFPRDRVALNQVGRLQFLKRRFPEARATLQRVLAIDPEDLQAHYNLMLAARGLGDTEAARRHETLYRRFKADESAQAITGEYRQLHPEDNNERQAIHEHGGPWGGATSTEAPPVSVDASNGYGRRPRKVSQHPSLSRPVVPRDQARARDGATPRARPVAWRPAPASPPAPPARFTDVTAAAGIRFRHVNGAFGKKYLPETMGSGVAFFDFDGDGRQDLFFVNGARWPGRAGPPSLPALYRNQGDGTFRDVTRGSGLDVETYGLGVTAADYDNDGDADLYLTALGPNRLFRNEGGGRFRDVTASAGVGDPGFSTSAAFLDYDKDGRLDLFVCNYVEWSPEKDLRCTLNGRDKSYCTPESYKGQSATLYRNAGQGRFEDVTARAGLRAPTSKALGVSVVDFDADSWPDLFVANDTQPNQLFRNRGDGTFVDVATSAGVAFSEAGVARAGMGVDAGDYDLSGRPSLAVGNFSNESLGLYRNEGGGLFIDDAPVAGLAQPSLLTLTFGLFFFDFDLDGLLDLFAANGHVENEIQSVQPKVAYAQPAHLFRNLGGGRFRDVAAESPALSRPLVARGAAYADYDGDGDLDLVLSANNGPARLLRNDAPPASWLRVRAVGSASNRDGLGTLVTATLKDGRRLAREVKTGSSYCSQSELPVTFGLGAETSVPRLELRWPSGTLDVLADVPARRTLTVREGQSAKPDR